MKITNRVVLQWLGFEPSGDGPMVVDMSLRMWWGVLWWRVARKHQTR